MTRREGKGDVSKARFSIGARVCDLDLEREGIVLSIGDVDPVAGRRYLVSDVYGLAPAKWRNESQLREAAPVSYMGSRLEGWS